MGLGKTPIAIAAAEELFGQEKISCCLIVCPASLKYQWAQKIAEFTDYESYDASVGKEVITIPLGYYCVLIDGDKLAREALYEYINLHKPRYIVIGYDNVLIDYPFVSKIKAEMVVLDEATAIKSFKAQRSKRIKKLLRAPYRLALTGTPIENKPDELFSIMQWVDAEVLGRFDLFDRAYINRNKNGWVVSYKNLHVLKRRLEPAVSRLTADAVEVKGLMPSIDEQTWLVKADQATNDLYVRIASDMLAEMDKIAVFSDFNPVEYLLGQDESTVSGKLMAMYTCLEMLTNHPDLIIWSGLQYYGSKNGGSKYAYELWQTGAVDNILSSAKFRYLCEVAEKLPNEKILVYSKYKYMLTLIAQVFAGSAVQHHGSMSPVKKAEAIAKFRNDPDCRFFLSSDAGAYGLDMNMSDLLINYDLPWSAGKLDQRNSRHRRRSSTFETVTVRNLILKNSFEERRVRILDRKRSIGSAILDGYGANAQGKIVLEGDSLRQHLTTVVQAGIMDSN
jgi:SNF2 family DNA or RNA helicase